MILGGSCRRRSGEPRSAHTTAMLAGVCRPARVSPRTRRRRDILRRRRRRLPSRAREAVLPRCTTLRLGGRGPGDLTIAAIRFNDSRVGPGVGAFANAGLGLASQPKLRAIVLRSVGDTDYHAWRWRAGPEVRLASELTLGAYYLRIEEDGSSFGSAGFEVTVPVRPNMAGQVGSSYGKWNGGANRGSGRRSQARGARAAHVQLLSEIDVGATSSRRSTTSHSGGGPLGGLPIVNGVGKGGSRRNGAAERLEPHCGRAKSVSDSWSHELSGGSRRTAHVRDREEVYGETVFSVSIR